MTNEHGPAAIWRLHVIDGLHRGASIDLAHGQYRLGPPDEDHGDREAEEPGALVFHDWIGERCQLTVAADGILVSTGEGASLPWPDGARRTLGGIALRLGDAVDNDRAQAHPPLATTDAPMGGGRRVSILACGGLCLGLLIAASMLSAGVLAGTNRSPDNPGNDRSLSPVELNRRLHAHGLSELEATDVNGQQRIAGIVADGREDGIARGMVNTLPAPRPKANWVVASEVAAAIESALRVPELEVRYLGGGRFVVEGRAPSPERIEAVAVQLRNDLGHNLRDLQIDVASSRRARTYAAMMVAGGLHYDERPDGTKRFGVPIP